MWGHLATLAESCCFLFVPNMLRSRNLDLLKERHLDTMSIGIVVYQVSAFDPEPTFYQLIE